MLNLFTAKVNKPFVPEAVQLVNGELRTTAILVDGPNVDIDINHFSDIKYDYVFSYIGPWIIPKKMLENTKYAAINFHPGPPEYPGIGCTNFALYDGAREFGITVHHMEPKVDSGKIIMTKRFPIAKSDTVWTLSQKCYAYIFAAFCELLPLLRDGIITESQETWQREPYTRKQLDELCVITRDMSEEEIKRRVRATTYPGMPGAYIELAGVKFNA